MKKLFTLAALCLAGASVFNANATEVAEDFYGFGTLMGSYFDLNYVQFAEIEARYDAENVGDEWKWTYDSMFNCNYDPGSYTSFNSGWIRNGYLYGAGNYYHAYADMSDRYNRVLQMDASGNIINTIDLGVNGKYGYLVKAVLNPKDDMLYCWTSDFTSNIYFGKINPDKLDNFSSEFVEITNKSFSMSVLPLTFCQKDDLFYFITNDLKFTSITTDGTETLVGRLEDVDSRFSPASWTANDYRGGLAMIYSKESDKFIWNTVVGNEESSSSVRLYAFSLPTNGTTIYNEAVVMKGICGDLGHWTAFVEPGNLEKVEPGTPKAPTDVVISEAEGENRYMISWTPVTECVEADKPLDAANLTYRVLLNDEVVEQNLAQSYTYVTIEKKDVPMDYTAHVWAVTPNAESAEASSNTITVGMNGVDAINTEAVNTIYTVLGTKVNAASAAELPAGLYIINGKKVVVK